VIPWTRASGQRWLMPSRCSVREASNAPSAVSLRGQPRMTVDVDLVMATDVEHALGLARGLSMTAFKPLFDSVEDVIGAAFILPLRHRMTGVRVDLAIGMSGFEREAIARATHVHIGETSAPVVTVEDLLVMKALAGRPQDEQDIRGCRSSRRGDRLDSLPRDGKVAR